MHKTTLTIITVTYNAADMLEKTITSVLEQSYTAVEYIIIDGKSTDNTVNIIKKYETQLAYWESKIDRGIYHAMNKGIEKATGDWICFLNAGDVFVDKNVLAKVVEHILTNKPADILYGNIITMGKNGENFEKKASAPCNKHRMYFCHQSAFVRTDLIKKHPYDEKYKMSADFKFFKEAYYRGNNFIQMHFPVTIYDRSGISNSNRAAGLLENINVIKEVDKGISKYKFMSKLLFTVAILKLKNSKKK